MDTFSRAVFASLSLPSSLVDRLTMPSSPLQLVQLSKAQDVEAGDGTTSVVVLAGSLLTACERLLSKGIHPSVISSAFQLAASEASKILEEVSGRSCAVRRAPPFESLIAPHAAAASHRIASSDF